MTRTTAPSHSRTPIQATSRADTARRAVRVAQFGLSLLLLALLASGCTDARASTPLADVAPPEGVLRITVTEGARGLELSAPDLFRSGTYRIHLHNVTASPHAVRLVRIDDDTSVADAMRAWRDALAAGTALPGILTPIDGPAAAPHAESPPTTRHLAPGRYLIACDMPGRDGRHLALGEWTILDITTS